MKVQITLLLNVEVNRSDYIHEETDTDDYILEHLRDRINGGDLSMDDLIEQSADYTVTVTVMEGPAA